MAVNIENSPAHEAGHVPHRGSEASGLVGRTAELVALCDLLAAARDGRSGVLLISGEAGIGKSVLLDYVEARAEGFHTARVAGVESEMELPYAGLQQLCQPFVDRLPSLPAPLRDAISTAIGLGVGRPRNRFLVGLAVLQLLAGLAEERPVLSVVDAAQWLDRPSVATVRVLISRFSTGRGCPLSSGWLN